MGVVSSAEGNELAERHPGPGRGHRITRRASDVSGPRPYLKSRRTLRPASSMQFRSGVLRSESREPASGLPSPSWTQRYCVLGASLGELVEVGDHVENSRAYLSPSFD